MDIKPCPFCGGSAIFDCNEQGWNWIECTYCHSSTNVSVSAMDDCKPVLSEKWNSRHIPEGYAIVSADCIQISLSALEFWVKWIKDNSYGDMEPIEHHYATGAIHEIKAMIAAAQDENK